MAFKFLGVKPPKRCPLGKEHNHFACPKFDYEGHFRGALLEALQLIKDWKETNQTLGYGVVPKQIHLDKLEELLRVSAGETK